MKLPILFLHGVTRCARSFDPLLPLLSFQRQVQAIDFSGHGDASRRQGAYKVTDYVSDVAPLLERPTILYGHSMGAMVAALVAREQPHLVSALVLEDPPFDTMGDRILDTGLHSYFSGLQRFAGSSLPLPDLARELAEMRFGPTAAPNLHRLGDQRDATALRFTASCLKQLDPEVLQPVLEQQWLRGYDVAGVLRKIVCPVLLFQADIKAGGMLTPEDANRAAALIPDCTRVQFPGSGHLLHWVATQDVLRAVFAFLGSLPHGG